MNYIFYDTETTGLSPAFDQVVQFAAILTDDQLNEIDRFEVRSRLSPFVIPSLSAMLVTGQSIDDLCSADRPSRYEMVCQMRAKLISWGPATYLGYNSLRFDEEHLRQSFYQCLHTPYLTNKNNNRRGDGLHLVRATAAVHPDELVVPVDDKGARSLRLDKLAPANGFDHKNAHDALADVEALIHIVQKIRTNCPSLWAQFCDLTAKREVEELLKASDACLLIETGHAAAPAFAVTAIGEHPVQSNIVYAVDLTTDLDELRLCSDEELRKALNRKRRPVRKVKKNAPPILWPVTQAPLGIIGDASPEHWLERGRLVRSDRDLVRRLLAAASEAEATYPPSPHPEKQIYDGFWQRDDERLIEVFHAAPWEERAEIVDRFEDQRLVWLGRRLVWAERPDLLPASVREIVHQEAADRLRGDATDWLTIARAKEALEKAADGRDLHPVLDGYGAFLERHWCLAVN